MALEFPFYLAILDDSESTHYQRLDRLVADVVAEAIKPTSVILVFDDMGAMDLNREIATLAWERVRPHFDMLDEVPAFIEDNIPNFDDLLRAEVDDRFEEERHVRSLQRAGAL